MAVNLQQLTKHEDLLAGGHRACAGCTGANILRQVMLTAGADTVLGGATGCMEVVTTIFPYTAWKTPFIHSAFENSAATVSGVETAFRALKKRGELPVRASASISSPSAATAAPTTSACSRCPGRWSAATTCSTSATTTRPT